MGDGYDRLHDTYVEWSTSLGDDIRHQLIDTAISRGAAGRALDLGCGTGELATDHLHRRGFDVVGVDISAASVARARERRPESEFVVADMTELHLPGEYFDLVTAFYSVIHVPRSRQGALFREIAFWLAPGGLFVLNVEPEGGSGKGWTDSWLDGVPMFWSAWHSDETRRLLRQAGMAIVDSGVDGRTPERFLWLIAQKLG